LKTKYRLLHSDFEGGSHYAVNGEGGERAELKITPPHDSTVTAMLDLPDASAGNRW
jgi:hypothetical protein